MSESQQQATEDVVPISLHPEEDDDDNADDLIFTTEDTRGHRCCYRVHGRNGGRT